MRFVRVAVYCKRRRKLQKSRQIIPVSSFFLSFFYFVSFLNILFVSYIAEKKRNGGTDRLGDVERETNTTSKQQKDRRNKAEHGT